MVDTKTGDERTTNRANEALDTIRENVVKVIDEIGKVQPQYNQSIANLQLEYIRTMKSTVQTVFSAPKDFSGNTNITIPGTFKEQFIGQANEFTGDLLRTLGTNNQLTINALEAARENLKIFGRTFDAITEFNTNAVKFWTSVYSAQQQQLFKQ